MKKVIYLWTALLLTAMPLLQAQNPVRNLKAEVERNRYVRLSWDQPLVEDGADVVVSEPADATFDLWRKDVYDVSSDMVRFGDTLLVSHRTVTIDTVEEYPQGRVTTKLWKELRLTDKWAEDGYTLDYADCTLLKVYDTVKIVKHGTSPLIRQGEFDTAAFMLKVGDYVYAGANVRTYRTFINKYRFDDWKLEQTIHQIVPEGGRAKPIQALTYVPELNDGKGGLVMGFFNTDQYQFLSLEGELLENAPVFELDAVEKTENKKWIISGIAYYDSVYYILGDDKVRTESNSRTFYIDAFDFNGKYLGRKKNVSEEYEAGKSYYDDPRHFFTMTDAKTGNTYLGVSLEYGKVWYYEIATVTSFSEYDVKRNGTELTPADYKNFYFLDTLKEPGTYTYAVATRYGDIISPDETAVVTIEAFGDCKAPTELTATVYNRHYVALDWQRPLRDDEVKADRYYISRNGVEIGVSDYAGFVDSVLPGTYQYTVRAEYSNSGMSVESVEVSATVSGKVAAYAPRELSAVSYIDDKGEGRVDLAWETPVFGPEATVSYSEMEAGGKAAGHGMGVLYQQGDLAYLDNYVMDKVSFVVGRQGKYRVVVYKDGQAVYDAVLDSTKVNVNARTEFVLSKPIRIDAKAVYLVAVVGNIHVGAGNGVTSDKSAKPVGANMSFPLTWTDSTSTLYYSYWSVVDPGKTAGNYNIEAHFTALHNVELEGEHSDFEGYAIYRNGEKLPDVLLKELTYADQNLADGDYTYMVASVWKGGQDLKSNAVGKNVLSLYGAPDNFAGAVSADTVSLTWQAPLSGAPVVKRWDSGKNAGKLGNKSGGILYAASLFTPDDMKSFAEFSIKQVEIFLAERVRSLSVVVYNGEEKIYEQAVPTDKLKLADFNIIALDRPVTFDAMKDLRVGYMVDYNSNGRPVGVDASETADGKGNQISLDGKTWSSASEQGVKNNFNIAVTLQYFNTKEVAKGTMVHRPVASVASTATVFEPAFETVLAGKVSKLDNNEFSGFNVYRDDEKLTATPIKDLAYTDITADSGRYAYKVSAVYTLTDEMFSQSLTFDTKKPGTGGSDTPNEWDALAEGVRIYPNPAVSTLYVSGAYDSFRLTDLYGRTVLPQTAAASAIEVSGLPSGQYLLILTKAGRESVQKITVR